MKEDVRELEPEIYEQLFLPVGNLVALQLIPKKVTQGGIHLPDGTVKRGTTLTLECWVVGVGPYCEQLKRGDRVLVSDATQATTVKYGNQEILMCIEGAVLGVTNWKDSQCEEMPPTYMSSEQIDKMASEAAKVGNHDAAAKLVQAATDRHKEPKGVAPREPSDAERLEVKFKGLK